MKIRAYLALITAMLLKIHAHAQVMDYQMLKAINSTGALINYLEQNNFTDASHPDSSFLYYEGQYKGDYLKVGKGWKGEVFEMGWAVVDEAGNTIPERLKLGDLQFAATYKENRKLHPSIFSSKKPVSVGTSNVVNFGLGDSKAQYIFDDSSESRNPKLTQIIMLRPNNNKQNLNALNSRSSFLKTLALSNIPDGTAPFASEIVDEGLLHFKKTLSLSLNKDEVVVLDLPKSLLVPKKNKDAVIYIRPKKPNDCINLGCTTTLNFKVKAEDGESLGDTYRLKKSKRSTRYTNTTHKLTNDLERSVSFKAEVSTSEDLEVDVYYFEGPSATEAFITHAVSTKKILEDRDMDVLDRKLLAFKERHGYVESLSTHFLAASKRQIMFNGQFGRGLQHFLIKAEGKIPPSFKLDFESYIGQIDNRAILTIDKNDKSYSFQDGFHFFEFELNIKHQGWLVMSAKNEQNESQRLTYYIHEDDPDSTIHHIEMTSLMTTHTEDYFDIWRETTQRRVDKAMADMKSFSEKYDKKDKETISGYLNAIENRVNAGATTGSNVSKSVKAILDQLGAGQNTSVRLKQLKEEYTTFKAHISEATLNAIRGKCDNAYNILSNIEDDWFGYGGEAIQVDFANMENAANTGNQQAFARWAADFTQSMQKIADKLERGLSAVEGCR